MPPIDHLLADLLDAAGFRLESHLFGALWVATHLDTGLQIAGEDPVEVARTAIRRLRQEYAAEVNLAQRHTISLNAIIQGARSRYEGRYGLASAARQGDPVALTLINQGLV